MTLVDDDQVKEIRGELRVDVLLFLNAGHGLVEAEVNLECLIDGTVRNLGHRLAERLEVVGLGLVGEDVAIDEEEDAFLGSRFPKAPDDLKGSIGLARAGRHDEQDAVHAAGNGVHRAVDGMSW